LEGVYASINLPSTSIAVREYGEERKSKKVRIPSEVPKKCMNRFPLVPYGSYLWVSGEVHTYPLEFTSLRLVEELVSVHSFCTNRMKKYGVW